MAKEDKTIKLADFLEKYREAITERVIKEYPSLYSPETRRDNEEKVKKLLREPYVPQWDAMNALSLVLKQGRNAIVVGEMGCGKTIIGIGASYLTGFRKVLVWVPPHLTKKWQREIEMTVPGAEVVHLKKVGDVQRLMRLHPHSGNGAFKGNLFAIVSRERAKLSYKWKPAVVRRLFKNTDVTIGVELTDAQKKTLPLSERVKYIPMSAVFKCPDCGASVIDDEGLPLSWEDLRKRRSKCKKCGSTLWEADKDGHRRYAIAEYIKRHHRNYFDLFIIDEAHEAKARGTAQGYAAGMLAASCNRTLTLVGTLFGGYSSNLFYLLYRLTTDFRNDFEHNQETKWISMYGILETIRKTRDLGYDEDNYMSRGRKYSKITKEKPGISPVILPKYLLDKTVFIRLNDLGIALPKYEEFITTVAMTEQQEDIYQVFRKDLRSALIDALRKGDRSLLSKYLQSLLTWPDRSYVEEVVRDREDNVVASAMALPEEEIYPKQEKLTELCKASLAKGRKVLVYCSHTDTKDITERLATLLREKGLKTVILKSSVQAEKREDWIRDRLDKGLDVLITNPKCVQTGLDLVDFPTIVFQEIEYSVFVLRQASRRSWRIGQNRDVEVHYFVYDNTIQTDGLKLIATKYKASLGIEGEFLDDGLAVYNTSCESDLYYDLAKSIVGEIEIGGSVEDIWREVRTTEKTLGGDGLLLSDEHRDLIDETEAMIITEEEDIVPEKKPEPAHAFKSTIDIEELRKKKAEAKKPIRKRKEDTKQIALFNF